MIPEDMNTLIDMKKYINTQTTQSKLAPYFVNQFITLRDALEFKDKTWYDNFDYHLITLASVEVFYPANDEENRLYSHLLKLSLDEILKLVEAKLNIE